MKKKRNKTHFVVISNQEREEAENEFWAYRQRKEKEI